ncbi:glycosyltransferase [Nocardioides sp. CBS4Y-1]|uniref:Glycosyltransferase n=1 Tax=Nocardioides acrostichi TaxID=2784339 RepID=A0A930Y7X8_9ACTN|nr:glycosyltransferase [Nocardioides acrostichi]
MVVLNESARTFFEPRTTGAVHLIPNFTRRISITTTKRRRGWVFAGRLTHEKGLRQLLENWPSDELLSIYGAGSREAEYKSVTKKLPNVTWCGTVPRAVLREALARAEGLLVPSLWQEGIPTVAIEALAVGTPVAFGPAVTSANGFVGAGAGVLLDPYRSESVRAALGDMRRSDRSACLKYFNRMFTEDVWLAKMGALMDSI